MNWFELFDVVYRVSVTIIPLLLVGCVWWLKAHFAGTKELRVVETDITAINARLGVIETKIAALAGDMESAPTRLDLLSSLSRLGERMSSMEASSEADRRMMQGQFTALNQTLSTHNQYLHTLIEQGMLGGTK